MTRVTEVAVAVTIRREDRKGRRGKTGNRQQRYSILIYAARNALGNLHNFLASSSFPVRFFYVDEQHGLKFTKNTTMNFTESQNHRMFGVGRDLCGSSSPNPLPTQGHLQQAAQDHV